MIASLALAAVLLSAPAAHPSPQRAGSNPAARGQRPAAAGPARPAAQSGDRTGAPSGPQGSDGSVPRVQEVDGMIVINVDEQGTENSIDLEWLTKLCQTYTDNVFFYDEPTAGQLRQAKLRLIGEKRVPIDEIYSFYQIIMFINGFILTKVGPEPLSVVMIQNMQPQGGRAPQVRNEAVYVTPEELELYSSQVATQVVTVLHLPHTDVRQLGNSLRALTADPSGSQNVVPVGNTNSVILTGFASSVASLARILKLVDEESARDTGVEPVFDVIPLEFAAAEDMAEILEQLLEAARRNLQGTRAQVAAQGATGQIQGSGGETKILTWARNNSLLVMALPDDMRNIRELVARLDVDVIEPERTYHVYALDNVKAQELADVLEDFMQGANRVSQGAGGGQGGRGNVQPGGGQGLSSSDQEVVVVADEPTNSLLIAASKRSYEEILELITKLDRRKDQVLIETALIELSGRDTLDIGVELGLADIPGSGTGGFGITNFGLSTFQDTTGDGIPDLRIPNQDLLGVTGGLIDGGDFSLPFLLNAIKTRNDTNVLNIPSVLVNNNGSATVQSIEEQATATTTNSPNVGTQQGFQGYEEAGITMQISPSISASGYLRLDVTLEVSNFNGAFSGGIPPPRTTRTVTTSVNVPDGDTMVIGGIVTDNDTNDTTRTPLLGDLPIIGRLFRRDSNSKNRTTLYFFVTPHILQDKNFADLAEVSYQIKLKAADRIGADRVKMIDPDFRGAEDAIDLTGFEVPLYRSPPGGELAPQEIGLDPVQRAELLERAGAQENPR